MRKLIVKMSVSMDGFVAGVHGENDWIFKTGDEESLAWSVGQSWEAGLIIMGRKSFELMAPYWPTATGPFAAPMNEIPKAVFTQKGYAGILPTAEPSPAGMSATASAKADLSAIASAKADLSAIASAKADLSAIASAKAEASWAEARIFDGDLAEEIRALKAEPGKPIVAIGGADFVQSLIATGLVDEYLLATHPVVLGAGLPIFQRLAAPLYLKLVDVKAFPGGVIAKTYRI